MVLWSVMVMVVMVMGEQTTIYDPEEDRVLELYLEEDQTGEPQTFFWHQADLRGSWASVRQSGLWMLYSETHYQGENVTVMFGDDLTLNIQHPVGSVRYAGNSRAKTLPALILYAQPWFRGKEYVVEVGPDESDGVMVPNFRDFGSSAGSMVAVGSSWTIFSGRSFMGPFCTCLRPTHFSMSSYDDDDALLMASFYPDLSDLGPVGSAMMTCEEVPMKRLCRRVPEQNLRTSRCPVLSNTNPRPCEP